MIREKIAIIQQKITQICLKQSRDPSEVILVGVTKYTSPEKIKQAIEAGLTVVGENYVQEAIDKFDALGESSNKVAKHMIGHLQTNKAKLAVPFFDMIQSVDSFKLAREIDKQALKIDKVMDILIEVNCSGEEQKFGISKELAEGLIDQLTDLGHIQVRGLMTMAPFVSDQARIRDSFSSLRIMKEQIAKKFSGCPNIDMKYLSMGMSGDFEIALEEGANMLRIGSLIFDDETMVQ